MRQEKPHIISYKTYLLILAALIGITLISVAVTNVELGAYNTAGALILAGLKTLLVLLFFMHLKFDRKIFALMVLGVLFILLAVIIITFLDYSFR